MTFDLSVSVEYKVTIERHIEELLLRKKTSGLRVTPATETLFGMTNDLEILPMKRAEAFHSTVAQLLLLVVRVRPDALTTIHSP